MLALGHWTPDFTPSPKLFALATIWLCLPELPQVLWMRSALSLIISPDGRLVWLDPATKLLSKARYAHVAVEIDLSGPIVSHSDVVFENSAMPTYWQRFEYEHIHLFCRLCGRVGHALWNVPPPDLLVLHCSLHHSQQVIH